MRILFDANVWISAASTNGFSRKVVRAAIHAGSVITTPELVAEVVEKLAGPLGQPSIVVEATARTMRNCEHRIVAAQPKGLCRDIDDDLLLAQAIATRCEFLVTNDNDLLVLEHVEQLRLLRVAEIASRLGLG